jgi:hypothetical protein
MASVQFAYAYPFESTVDEAAGRQRLRLATCSAAEEYPYFYSGALVRPPVASEALLTVARVARTRFYIPPGMLQRILLAADPVVTADGARLRFESFSACCGAYARADLLPAAIDGDFASRGTTNVDFNQPMRAALAQLGGGREQAGLKVGADAVELERLAGKVVERKVPLPVRWLKGFVEVQAYAARLKLLRELPGPEARRFLASIPNQVKARDRAWLVIGGRQLRLSRTPSRDTIEVGGIGRLQALKQVARHAKALRIYGAEGTSASGWELEFGDSRLQLILSPDASRGFSGEGQVLEILARKDADAALAKVRAALSWQAALTPEALAAQLGGDADAAAGALAALGSHGLVGYDLAEGAWFHRVLPFDMDAVEKLHPRLVNARKIVEAGALKILNAEPGKAEAQVEGTDTTHRVRETDGGFTCTCPWYADKVGEAGPCKHILAVQIALDEPEDE